MTLVVGHRGWFSGGGGGLDAPGRVRVRAFANQRRCRRSVAVSATAAVVFTPVEGWDDDDNDGDRVGYDRSLATAKIWQRRWCHRRPRRTVTGQRDRRRPSSETVCSSHTRRTLLRLCGFPVQLSRYYIVYYTNLYNLSHPYRYQLTYRELIPRYSSSLFNKRVTYLFLLADLIVTFITRLWITWINIPEIFDTQIHTKY